MTTKVPEQKIRLNNNPTFVDFNTNENVLLERLSKRGDQSLFAAALAFDRRHNGLLVLDNQDGLNVKIRNKIPGGVYKDIFTTEQYLAALEFELRREKAVKGTATRKPYPLFLRQAIINNEMWEIKRGNRNLAMKSALLEFFEETGMWATKLIYVCDGFRYNTKTEKNDLLQVFFLAQSVISDNSTGLNDIIKNFRKVTVTKSSDPDILDMRVIISINDLISRLGYATHKIAAKEIIGKQSRLLFELSEKIVDEKTKNFLIESSQKYAASILSQS